VTSSGAARHLRSRPEVVTGNGDVVEAEFASDRWDAFVLGVPARRGRNIARFASIEQPWLREAVKSWSRFRLGAGYAFGTIDAGGQHMARFSAFLTGRPEVVDHTDVTRDVLEAFLLWMALSKWSATTRSGALCFVKTFLEWGGGVEFIV